MVDRTPRDRHGNVLENIRSPTRDELRDAKSRTYCSGCTRRLPGNLRGVCGRSVDSGVPTASTTANRSGSGSVRHEHHAHYQSTGS
jgi:hypothetical protein